MAEAYTSSPGNNSHDSFLNATTTTSSSRINSPHNFLATGSSSVTLGLSWLLMQSARSRPDDPYSQLEVSGRSTPSMLGSVSGQLLSAEDWSNVTQRTGASFSDLKNHTVMVSCVMFGTGVLGNLLALFVLATSALDQRRTLFYKLVAGLAVTDLVGTCATSPVVIAVYLNDFRWLGGQPLCHYFSFAMIFAGYATMLIVCAMAVERYICVRHPYTYHTRFSAKFGRLTLLGCWALSAAIAALPLVGVGSNVQQYPRTWCFFDYLSPDPADVAFNFLYPIVALIAVAVTFVCNVRVIATLLTLRARQSRLDASDAQVKRGYRVSSQRFAEVQMVVMLFGITVVFTACFAPLMIFVLICQTSLVQYIDSKKSILLFIRLASFNPILDPWVYILFRRELVWKLVRFFRYLLGLPPLLPPGLQNQARKEPSRMSGATQNGGGGGGGAATATARVNGRESADMSEPSCLSFCYQCLCLPPVPRAAALVGSRHSCTTAVKSVRSSPSLAPAKRNSSAERLTPTGGSPTLSSGLMVTRPPSPADHLLLKQFANCRDSSPSLDSSL